MRIISGEKRGMKLFSPNIKARPTEDINKERLFNIIYPVALNSIVLDLFSGSGSIGLEFLSRGAKKAFFVEKDFDNFQTINKNIKKANYENRSKIMKMDFKKALKIFQRDKFKFDYIFIDPPYKTEFIKDAISLIEKYDLLVEDGIIIYESDRIIDLNTKYIKVKTKEYKNTVFSIYRGEK